MIKYVTTIEDILSDTTEYYLYDRLNIGLREITEMTLNEISPTKTRKEDPTVGCIVHPDNPGYFLIRIVVDTRKVDLEKMGSIVFVQSGSIIGYYNFDNYVDVHQSSEYIIEITFNFITKEVSNFRLSSELYKYNPNSDKESSAHLLNSDSLLISDYNAYSTIYKSRKARTLSPDTGNVKFNAYGGVFLFDSVQLNFASNFVVPKVVTDDLVGARLLYSNELTSLILWSGTRLYYYKDIFTEGEFSSVELEGTILDCSDKYIIVQKEDHLNVMTVNWKSGKILDYSRKLVDCDFYIDNLLGTLNVVQEGILDTTRIRTLSTRTNWTHLIGGVFMTEVLTSYGSYLGSYKTTFILEHLNKGEVSGIIIIGAGSVGAVVGIDLDLMNPIFREEGYSFVDLIKERKLNFEFLNNQVVRMYYYEGGKPILDNIIYCDSTNYGIEDTITSLTNKLNFLRITGEVISKEDKLVFGNNIALVLKTVEDDKHTKIIQI